MTRNEFFLKNDDQSEPKDTHDSEEPSKRMLKTADDDIEWDCRDPRVKMKSLHDDDPSNLGGRHQTMPTDLNTSDTRLDPAQQFLLRQGIEVEMGEDVLVVRHDTHRPDIFNFSAISN